MYYSGKYATMQGMDVRGFLPMRRIVNIFGAVGYSLLISSGTIALGVLLMWLVYGGQLEIIGVPREAATATQTGPVENLSEPSFIIQVITYFFTIVTALGVLFMLVTLPHWLGRFGSQIIKRAIRYCQHPVTLTSLLFAKILACGLVVSVLTLVGLFTNLEFAVILVLMSVTLFALIVFLIQHYLAKMSEVVVAKDVW